MTRRHVAILCIQEMKWKGEKVKEVEDTVFKLWYTCTTTSNNGVGTVLDKSLNDGVMDIKRRGDRIILVLLLIGDMDFNVISAYAPQIGPNESVKR
jgi:exonuclease III